MNENELQFVLKMQDQASSVMQQFGSSTAQTGEIIKQQIAAMNQLTAALNQHASATNTAATAAKSHAASITAGGSAARGAASEHKGLASTLGEVGEKAKAAGEALIGMWASNEMIKGAIEQYQETDHAIRSIMAGADLSREAVEDLHKSLANMPASQVNATVSQLDKLAVLGAKLHGTSEEIKGFAVAVGQIATGGSLEAIGQGVQQILSATGEGAGGATKLADALGVLGEKTRGGVEGLTQMTGMMASMTAGMGISSEKLAQYAAAFDKIGGRPMMQVMQFNMILQQIEKQARSSGAGLTDLAARTGMTVDAMQKLAQQHPDEVYNRMLEVVSKMKEQGTDPGAFLKGFGIQAGREMQQIEALASKYKELQAIQNQDTTGGAAKYQKDMANEFDLAVTDLTKAWEKLKDELGEDFIPIATAAFKALAEVINIVVGGLHDMGPAGQALADLALVAPGIYGVVKAVLLLRSAITGLGALFGVEGAGVAAGAATAAAGVSAASVAVGAGAGLVTGALVYGAGRATGNAINQQLDLSKQGVTLGDQLQSFNPFTSKEAMDERMRDKYYRGQFRPGATVGLGETTTSGEDASEMQRQRGQRSAVQANPQQPANDNGASNVDASAMGGDTFRDLLVGMDEYQKKLKEIQDQQNEFNKAVSQLTPEQSAQWGAEIAHVTRVFDLRRQAADPLLQENKALDDQIAKAGAVTKAAQNELAIREEIRKLEEKGVEITPAVRAQVGSKMQYAQGAEQAKAYDEEVKNLQKALAASGAVTAEDKQRVEIDQQIADMYEKGTIATQAQEQSVRNLLAAEKERTQYATLAASLSPVGKANQEYQESITLLQRALGPGQALNQAMEDLARNTQAARDPLGAMVTADEHELEILSQTGKYREAQVAALQEKYDLQQKGLTVDDKALADLTQYQKDLQDLKTAQSSGIAGWIGQGPDLQKQMGELAGDFSSDLADGIEGALQRKRGAFDQAGQALGKAMIKMATDDLLKSGAKALGLGDTSKELKKAQGDLPAVSEDAKRMQAQADQQAKALQDGLKNINTMTVAATNVTVNGPVSTGAPGTAVTGPTSAIPTLPTPYPSVSATPPLAPAGAITAAGAAVAAAPKPSVSISSGAGPIPAGAIKANPDGSINWGAVAPSPYGDLSAERAAFAAAPKPPASMAEAIANAAPSKAVVPGAGARFAGGMLPSGTDNGYAENASKSADMMGLKPAFRDKIQDLQQDASDAGIPTRADSGYRSIENQRRMYENHQAVLRGETPPYPNSPSPGVVAPPGGSYHNFGEASDVTALNAGQQSALTKMAEEPWRGIKSGTSFGDPNHYEQSQYARGAFPGVAGGTGLPANASALVAANSNKPPVDVNIHSMGGNPVAQTQSLFPPPPVPPVSSYTAGAAASGAGGAQGGDPMSMLTNGLMGDAAHIPGAAPYLQGFGMLKNLFGSLGGAGGAASGAASAVGGAASGAAGGLGSIFSSLFSFLHTGGTVGSTPTMGLSRRLSPAVFAGAQRFHDGLGDDEFPAVLQRGERVLTANQDQRSTALMSRMADAMANTSTPAGTQHADSGRQNQGGHRMTMIVNTPNASSFRSSQPQIMATQHAALQRMGAKHN